MTKTVLITGSTDGLGKAVAERLARQDWKILLHGRSEDKGTAVLAELRELTGNDDIYYFNADLSSLADTKRLADEILATQKRLDVLINNAGIGPRAPDSIRSLSKDGNELFLSVNYLAGYLLARQLLPLLSKSAPSRVINVASIAQVPLNFDDIMLDNDYSDYRAYSQSKLAQIIHTNTMAEQYTDLGVTFNSLHPATLMSTNMVTNSTSLPDSMSTVDDGADALERLVVSDAIAQKSGCYFNEQNEEKANAQAYDSNAQKQLMAASEMLIKNATKSE